MRLQTDLARYERSLRETLERAASAHPVDEEVIRRILPGDGLTASEASDVYRQAFGLFSAAKYHEALPLLVTLLGQAPMMAHAHFSVAACLHKLSRHTDAIHAYMAAYALDVTEALPLFHAADCLRALGKDKEARMTLREFISNADGEKHSSRIAQARSLLATAASNGTSRSISNPS